jgi:imidazolonepropionase-like amidohydrolase
LKAVVAYLAAKNAKIILGTDTPSSPTLGNPPGYNGFLDMKRLHDFGLSLEELLKAATLRNAQTFHLDKDIGSVEVGKVANLVLLKKDPLKTVEAYDSIEAVIVHGKVVKRDLLRAASHP